MKKILLAAMFLGGLTQLQAQTSGVVTYKETIKMGRDIENVPEQFRQMIPKEQKTEWQLQFTPEVALYEPVKKDEKENEGAYEENNGMRMVIKMDAPDEKFYTDAKNGTILEQRDFMGKKFLVETKLNGKKWKMTGNQQQLMNYPAQEAVMSDGDTKVTVWFTPAIPVPYGPSNFGGLPGLILKMDVNDGQHVVEASSVELKEVAKSSLKKPKGGTKVTEKEFKAVVEERTKEMGDGNDAVIIQVIK
jgi:GLPGLI family protein